MYEYKCIEFDSSVEAEAYMNKMGSVGWRVASTTWRESIPIRSLYVTFERVKAAAMGLSSDDLHSLPKATREAVETYQKGGK